MQPCGDHHHEHERAAPCLDRRYLPEDVMGMPPQDPVDTLRVVWSQQNIINLTRQSDQPEGHRDDGLPSGSNP